jgi:hypothetical protein
MATSPFPNCRFRECDLPGQCRTEGQCHHPALAPAAGNANVAAVFALQDLVRLEDLRKRAQASDDAALLALYKADIDRAWRSARAALAGQPA